MTNFKHVPLILILLAAALDGDPLVIRMLVAIRQERKARDTFVAAENQQ